MEVILKIILVGIITCIATMVIKPIRSDFSIIIAIVGGIIIICLIIDYLTGIFDVIKGIIDMTGNNSSIYNFLIKIIAIGYLIEFTAGLCIETGNAGLGDKVLLGGKIIIMVMALPIITNILQIIMELLPK